MRPLGEAQNKVMKAYTQSGQYHTIVESPRRTISANGGYGGLLQMVFIRVIPYKLSCVNRLVNLSSHVEQRTPKEKESVVSIDWYRCRTKNYSKRKGVCQ